MTRKILELDGEARAQLRRGLHQLADALENGRVYIPPAEPALEAEMQRFPVRSDDDIIDMHTPIPDPRTSSSLFVQLALLPPGLGWRLAMEFLCAAPLVSRTADVDTVPDEKVQTTYWLIRKFLSKQHPKIVNLAIDDHIAANADMEQPK